MSIRLLVMTVLAITGAHAAPVLFGISGDSLGIPRQLNQIDTATAVANPLFSLGNGSVGFNGGLAFHSVHNRFYAIANDNSGASSLVAFTLAGMGSFTTLFPLGTGFLGGLAYNSANGDLYSISQDPLGASTLNRISIAGMTVTPQFGLGDGFLGGLTFNSADGKFYALASDALGDSTLFSISGGMATAVGPVGAGFLGGIAFFPADGLLYAISSDSLANSTLSRISTDAMTITPVGGVGVGYLFAGLTVATDATVIPEPGTLLAAGSVLLLFLIRKAY